MDASTRIAPFTMTGYWKEETKSLKQRFSQLALKNLKFERVSEGDLVMKLEARLLKKRDEEGIQDQPQND